MSSLTEQSGLAAEVMGRLHRRGAGRPGLRMTPMIDVIFLLLTFFVLTAHFERPEQSLPLVFGATDAVPVIAPGTLELSIQPVDQGCVVNVGDAQVVVISRANPQTGLMALAERIQTIASTGGLMPIRLSCDDAVSWELVTRIYDVLYGLGARDIAFIVSD